VTPNTPFASLPTVCPACGSEIAPSLLACPACGRLVHGDELKSLAAGAAQAAREGADSAEIGFWREALGLLPANSRQYATISARVAELSQRIDGGNADAPTRSPGSGKVGKGAAAVGVVGALLAKFKLLLLGLTKASTLFSMVAFAGVYWALWGWKFAVGMAASIYVHEMGHVYALNRFGIQASAPMFIPGFGAMVRLKQYPTDAREDARVGLAGPIWGFAAAAVAYGTFRVSGAPIWAAIAQFGAFINLFNLIPVWQLDGARGFHPLSVAQRWLAVGVIAVAFALTGEHLLILLGLGAAYAAWRGGGAEDGDATAWWQYAALVIVLSLMTRIPTPGAVPR
jgi:Zn-dependent protease